MLLPISKSLVEDFSKIGSLDECDERTTKGVGVGGFLGQIWDPRPLFVIRFHWTWDPHAKTLETHSHVHTNQLGMWPSQHGQQKIGLMRQLVKITCQPSCWPSAGSAEMALRRAKSPRSRPAMQHERMRNTCRRGLDRSKPVHKVSKHLVSWMGKFFFFFLDRF